MQGHAGADPAGYSTGADEVSMRSLPSINTKKGYGKVGSQEDSPATDARVDIEAHIVAADAADEILDAELVERDNSQVPHGRHRKKKICVYVSVLLLLVVLVGGIVFSGSNDSDVGSAESSTGHHASYDADSKQDTSLARTVADLPADDITPSTSTSGARQLSWTATPRQVLLPILPPVAGGASQVSTCTMDCLARPSAVRWHDLARSCTAPCSVMNCSFDSTI